MSRKQRNSPDNGQIMEWKCSGAVLPLNPVRPLIMGILNVTPDSFSDGGAHSTPEAAVSYAEQMVADGADIIDVGGESTRPGAAAVSSGDELARILPVVEALASKNITVSIDTMKASVARRAVAAGARIINDVSACTYDPEMAGVAAATGAGVVLMHMQGDPRTMQSNPTYGNVVEDVCSYLASRAAALEKKGVARDSIALDPGIGFGKSTAHNLSLLAGIDLLGALGYPVLVGISRKSFLGKITGREVNERLAGSIAGLVWCIMKGVHIVRVHDVAQTLDAIRTVEALKKA